ncbi:unnamed protein product [Didymodactylos carnosus]|uniref:Uncharacterized protein n=1 Tax=Didymodactylos carnosus TaxID=1234261 RepID=A0A815XXH5_9BILA|nr:unnamed protein product [Didymodactylos carnosus]CAF1563049.1 unnamed protein product [Didymodactylos carnosus]CAF3829910.1 unnamed protein product [Didymodactylos carnosus]CAF4424673.1 unnamed protein product [Didymodactylos carnosus]
MSTSPDSMQPGYVTAVCVGPKIVGSIGVTGATPVKWVALNNSNDGDRLSMVGNEFVVYIVSKVSQPRVYSWWKQMVINIVPSLLSGTIGAFLA